MVTGTQGSPAPSKPLLVRVGDFFFKWRNQAFPLILLAIYLVVRPEDEVAGSERLELVRDLIAVSTVAAGLALRGLVIGFAYIKRGGVGKKVYAADLVTSGLFGVCRNPLYVGNLLVIAGILMMHGNPFVIAFGMSLMLFIYHCIVRAEEWFLRDKFGDGYAAYCADVPRWGFRLSRLSASLEGMRFDLKKAILVDYNPIANAAAILAATELYEQFSHPADPPEFSIVWGAVAVIAAALVWTAAIRWWKKRPTKAAPAPQ